MASRSDGASGLPRLSDILRLQAQRAAGVLPQDRPESQADGSGHYRQNSPYLSVSPDALTFANKGTFGGGLVSWPFELARGEGRDGSVADRLAATAEAFSPVQGLEGAVQSGRRFGQHVGHATGLSAAGPAYDFDSDDGKMAGMADMLGLVGMVPAAGVAAAGAAPKPLAQRGLMAAANPDDPTTAAVFASLAGQADSLPMDHASRLARMTEQGYQPMYHGTAADFTSFDVRNAGKVSGSKVGQVGVSGALEPDVASEFASLASQKLKGDPSVMPLMYRPGRQGRLTLDGTEKNLEVAATLSDAFDAGYDSVMLRNYTTPSGAKGKNVVVIKDPGSIRSATAAAFDPKHIGENNLLAANPDDPTTAAILALLSQQQGQNRP